MVGWTEPQEWLRYGVVVSHDGRQTPSHPSTPNQRSYISFRECHSLSPFARTMPERRVSVILYASCPCPVDGFDFRFGTTSVGGDGAVKVVALPTDEGDPCSTHQLDLSGTLTGFPSTPYWQEGVVTTSFETSSE